jgi:Tfp pilus assembly protein PilO
MQNDKNMGRNNYLSNIPTLTSEKNQKFFSIILTFCALSFFGFFAIKPTVSTILKLQKEISDNEFVLGQLETKIISLTQLKVQYSNLQNDLPIIMNAITAQPDIALLFAQIQSAGKTSNITFKRLQNSEVEIVKKGNSPEKNYYSYTFTIGGSGSSENIYKFMQTISNMERVVDIDTFSISNAADQKTGASDFNIQGTAFFKSNI